MRQIWDSIKAIYAVVPTRCKFQHLKPFMVRQSPKSAGCPKLRGRAAEIKGLVPVMVRLWEQCMNPDDALHTLVFSGLAASAKMDEILDNHRHDWILPGDSHDEFFRMVIQYCQSVQALHRWGGNLWFNATFKLHTLFHLGERSRWQSPRLSWCFIGEDYMKIARRMIHASSFGTKLEFQNNKA